MITVIGSGYVGLVTAACLAYKGYIVTCLDIDNDKIEALKSGEIPIFEPHLEEMVKESLRNGRIRFTTNYKEALEGTSLVILAVDTPPMPCGGCDLTNIKAAARSLASLISSDLTVVIKSTVSVGTSKLVQEIIDDAVEGRYIVDVVSNPEFLREGGAVHDFMHPDRTIIGVPNKRAEKIMRELYRPFNLPRERFIVMDPQSSELTKYAANTMLACRISFMNWLSQLCEAIGTNIESIKEGLGSDSRIGSEFLHAGIGFGGSCFPKDVSALISIAKEFGCPPTLIEDINNINEAQKIGLFSKISSYFEERGGLEGKRIAVLGLAFKPNTDDMREAPSVTIINELLKSKCHLHLFDPISMKNAQKALPKSSLITWCNDEWEALSGVDGVVLCTEWNQFVQIDLKKAISAMKGCAFFDGRNIFSPKIMGQMGFDYISVGRPPFYGSTELVHQALENEEQLLSI